jgi:predicted dehydrogenase
MQRVGILGTAAIAGKTRRGITASGAATVVAIASRDLAKAQAWAAEAVSSGDCPGPILAFGSYEELLADPSIDAVYVPLPCGLHVEWVAKAAAAGKAVLCEKPAANSVADLEAMLRALQGANKRWMDGTMFHHHSRSTALQQAYQSEAFGPIGRVTCAFSFRGDESFMKTNIRMSSSLERFGCL